MTTFCLPMKSIVRVLFSMSLTATAVSVAYSQVPSQVPLLVKAGAGVSPNVMLTLDDSGSMQFQHLPENVFAGGTFATTNPVGSDQVRWDLSDTYQIDFLQGTVPGNINSTNYVLKALRSPDTNTLFYNPETQYLPWLTAAGTRMSNSPPAAAWIDPLNTSGTKTNLTVYTGNGSSSKWCYSAASTAAPGSGGCANIANNSGTLKHDPGVYFRLQKTAGVYKNITNSANYDGFTINSAGPFTKYAGRVCAGTTCSQAEERQNYANWYTYYRTRNLMARGSMMESFATVGNVIRLGFGRINKGSASVDGKNTTVLESDVINYGGGGVRDFDAARKAQLFKWLENLPASGGTPLVAAMNAVGTYYSRTDSKGPWTDSPGSAVNTVANNKTCRRSYQILTTDGYWNGGATTTSSWSGTSTTVGNQDATAGATIVGPSGTYAYAPTTPYKDATGNTLADFAMMFWKNDLQPGMANNVTPVGDNKSFWQNMTNYTVGLGVRGTLDPEVDLVGLTATPTPTKSWPAAVSGGTAANIDDLWHAALNSRGQYFSAKDPTQLATAIRTALDGTIGGTGSTTGVATATAVLESGNRKYVPDFNMSYWSGDVSGIPLDALGQQSTTAWKASARLPLWSARNIYTWDTGITPNAAVPFNWGSLSNTNKTALGPVAAAHTTDFIEYLRGNHANEGVGNPFRDRVDNSGNTFVLGDFVNSTPVFVQGGFNGNYGGLNLGGTSGYQNFLTAKGLRTGVLFVGGNDGMVHVFQDSKALTPASALTDGKEVFAYVPKAVYGNLSKLADKLYGSPTVPHQYFVDGPQNEADAYVPAPGASVPSWRNYVIGSTGGGARAVYGLDVTNSPTFNASTVRWEISDVNDGDLGYVMQPIDAGVLPNGRWVAIFGNGFSSNSGNATLFVVDIATGVITKLTVDSGTGNGLGGVSLVRDANGQITSVYSGDLNGNLWRMDYDAATASNFSVFGGGPLFLATNATGGAQSITATPAVFNHSLGGKIVVFGSGKLLTVTDQSDTSQQTVYGVWDKPSTVYPIVRADSANMVLSAVQGTGAASTQTYYTVSGALNWANNRAWNIDMNGVLPGGRIVYPVQSVTSSFAYVSVVAPPGVVAVCDSGLGTGINLTIPPELVVPPQSMFDTDGSGSISNSDSRALGSKSLADGKDSILKGDAGTGTGTGGGGGMCPIGTHMFAAVNSNGGNLMCVPDCIINCTPPVTTKTYDRVWRRIVNPPIR